AELLQELLVEVGGIVVDGERAARLRLEARCDLVFPERKGHAFVRAGERQTARPYELATRSGCLGHARRVAARREEAARAGERCSGTCPPQQKIAPSQGAGPSFLRVMRHRTPF